MPSRPPPGDVPTPLPSRPSLDAAWRRRAIVRRSRTTALPTFRTFTQPAERDLVEASRFPVALAIVAALTVYLFTWPVSHDLGTLPFAGLLAVTAAYGLFYRRWVLGWPYAVVLAVYGFYCVISLLNWVPLSWTDARYPDLVPQQIACYLALPLFAAPTVDVLGWLHRTGRLRRALLIGLGVSWLGFGWAMATELGPSAAYLRVTDLTDIMFFRFAVIVFLLAELPQTLRRAALLLVVMAGLADDSQTQATVAAAALLLAAPYKRTASYAFIALLATAVIIAPPFWSQIWSVDRNSGLRAVFWRDALEAIRDTHWLGVGFGTQSIHYAFADFGAFALQGDVAKVRLIGLHNSFYQALFRCGVFGLAALVGWVVWLFSRVRENRYLVIQLWLLLAVMVSMCVNPSLESANFILGDAFALSLFLVLADAAARPAQDAVQAPLRRWSLGPRGAPVMDA